jgi:DNA-binding CsgD family transcriptional regulator
MKNKIHLTPRELQVLKLISKGLQRKTIASKLKISIHTVNDYVKSLHVKTNTHLWGELVCWAKDYKK